MSPVNGPSLADLEARASEAIAVEALWDGDTEGWFVDLCTVLRTPTGHASRHLHSFRLGGDLRIFNGQVPPWPEAGAAAQVGAELAAALGVPFHFPSPHHPEDDCPHWWERDSARVCARCSVVQLLQPANCSWAGVCYHCHLALEREKRDARFSDEQRRGPRCSMCGDPCGGNAGDPPRCAACRKKYRTFQCAGCGVAVTRHVNYVASDSCDFCVATQRVSSLSADDRRRLRKAADRGREGLIEALELLGCGLSDAQFALAAAAKLPEDDS